MAARSSASSTLRRANPKRLALLMRSINALSSAMLLATGVVSLAHVGSPVAFLFAAYTIALSAVLLVFELRLGKIDSFVADNFGFMFSWSGRANFLFFLSAMTFGLQPVTMSRITSIVAVFAIVVNVIIQLANPAVGTYLRRTACSDAAAADQGSFPANDAIGSYQSPPPAASVATADSSSALAFAASRPDMAKRGVDAVAAHPEAAKRFASAVSGNSAAASSAVDVISANPDAVRAAIDFTARHKDVAASVASAAVKQGNASQTPSR